MKNAPASLTSTRRSTLLTCAGSFQHFLCALSAFKQHSASSPPVGGEGAPHIPDPTVLKLGPCNSGRWGFPGALPGPCGPACRAGRVALAGGLTRVDVGMLLHVRLLVEALAAELAGIGPRVRVDEQVGGQRGRALEGFAAHLALEAALLPGETRPWGVRRRRRTGPGRDPLRNRTLCWGGLEGQAPGPPLPASQDGLRLGAEWPPVGFFLVTLTVSQTKFMFVDGLMDPLIWECVFFGGRGVGAHFMPLKPRVSSLRRDGHGCAAWWRPASASY